MGRTAITPQERVNTKTHRLGERAAGPAPDCPDWVSEDAKTEWARIVPELAAQRVLSPLDCMTLAAYCQAYSDWKAAVLQIRQEGQTILDRWQQPKLHPLVARADKLLSEIRRIGGEFGLSPSARSKIDVPPAPDKEKDALLAFLDGGNDENPGTVD